MTQDEIDQLQSKALEQFKTGKSLFGKDGAFAPMLKQFLEAALEAEMEAHLDEEERLSGNKRNGRGKKTVISATESRELSCEAWMVSIIFFWCNVFINKII